MESQFIASQKLGTTLEWLFSNLRPLADLQVCFDTQQKFAYANLHFQTYDDLRLCLARA